MTPPPGAPAPVRLRSPVAEPAREPQPSLRLVARRPRWRIPRVPRLRPGTLAYLVAAAVMVGTLLAVVAGHLVLAGEAVHLAGTESSLSKEQVVHAQREIAVSGLEDPSRIVGAAEGQLHMAPATSVVTVPAVPLSVPLPASDIQSAPTPPAAGSKTKATAGTTSTGPAG